MQRDSSFVELSSNDRKALNWERRAALGCLDGIDQERIPESLHDLYCIVQALASGNYAEVLGNRITSQFFSEIVYHGCETVAESIIRHVRKKGETVVECVKLELIGIACFNLFLQANYTGPCLDDCQSPILEETNPHEIFKSQLCVKEFVEEKGSPESERGRSQPKPNPRYHNAVLAELAVDGDWPVQVCRYPYYLLLARSIWSGLADPASKGWFNLSSNHAFVAENSYFVRISEHLVGASLWNARAVVAHERLLQSRQPSMTLWKEAETMYKASIQSFCFRDENSTLGRNGAAVMLEFGLAEHHFDRPDTGRSSFRKAQKMSGLSLDVTGAMGKRTKFQRKATAQMLVVASSAQSSTKPKEYPRSELIKKQHIDHSEEEILLERINFDDEKLSEIQPLNILDQCIVLAFCLDVKNRNPSDGLTAEEMGAFLARVLDHHDDWMVYSTALLERSWLEFERSHARERAILQMQALADQHTNRLTITQSTKESIEESAPVQDRLKNLHIIVYPPRWSMIQDLADRYASLGIVSSAAELYTEIEFWGEVVDCYRRAGRISCAEELVRERLAVEETPRMWEALGDLTNDPSCYRKAIEISKGRYYNAFLALGSFHFDKGELNDAAEYYEKALKIRPLVPTAWFRLGTICMRLEWWDKALTAFSTVVEQEPEESDAWANIGAIHMRNKHPAEAYPALVQSLKYARHNWRVWFSKLYVCLDLAKYDEAVQACNELLDRRSRQKGSSVEIPALEERCIRAIVGGTIKVFQASRDDDIKLESCRRTLTRVHQLLDRIASSSDAEAWVFETMAFFHESVGRDEKVLENLLKEYRALQTIIGWEKDDSLIKKVYQVVSHICQLHGYEETSEGLNKSRFMVRGIVKKIEAARPDDDGLPDEYHQLCKLLQNIEGKLHDMQAK